jgi:hypothetical protein
LFYCSLYKVRERARASEGGDTHEHTHTRVSTGEKVKIKPLEKRGLCKRTFGHCPTLRKTAIPISFFTFPSTFNPHMKFNRDGTKRLTNQQ